jgi:hypothetical protein
MLMPVSSVSSGAGALISATGFAIWIAFTGVALRGVLGTAIGVCSTSRTCGVIFFAFQNWTLAHSAAVDGELFDPLMQYQLGTILSFFNKYFSFFGKFLRFSNKIRDIARTIFLSTMPHNPLTARDFLAHNA